MRQSLRDKGFVVLDNYLGTDTAEKLLREIQYLHQQDKLSPNQVRFLVDKDHYIQVNKPGILEADLHADNHWGDTLDWIFHYKASEMAQEFDRELGLGLATSGHTIKAQVNQGIGGCFPWHYDNPGTDKRKLSCLLYLNKEWNKTHGGELL
jgi:Rps23 Pro-64 3,4-dihydroxylase Tpa1-like proline 4-hydroxylase